MVLNKKEFQESALFRKRGFRRPRFSGSRGGYFEVGGGELRSRGGVLRSEGGVLLEKWGGDLLFPPPAERDPEVWRYKPIPSQFVLLLMELLQQRPPLSFSYRASHGGLLQ